jgi:hypothetical protein
MEIKTGHYINDVWICDACIKNQEEEHEKWLKKNHSIQLIILRP